MWCNLLHFLLFSRVIGPVLITIWRMMASDVLKWVLIYGCLLLGFSQAMSLVIQDTAIKEGRDSELVEVLLFERYGVQGLNMTKMSQSNLEFLKYYILVTLGEVSQPAVITAGQDQILAWILHIVFLFMSTLLLFNLIIAMMGDTYSRGKTNEIAAMWWMMKASQVLYYEAQLTER